jgi:hypothetical protein
MSGLDQPPRHVGAHIAEPDEANVHKMLPVLLGSVI